MPPRPARPVSQAAASGAAASWRGRRFLVALALMLGLFTLALDGLTCAGEGLNGTGATAQAASVQPAPEPQGDQPAAGDRHGVCPHGHCHSGSFAEALATERPAPAEGRTATPPPLRLLALISTEPFGLRRPPRA